MEEKKSKYETKIEKLTFVRIFIVFLSEFLFEFSFGLVFFFFSENEGYYDDTTCKDLVFWTRMIWRMYSIEFSIAFVCFLIGISSLLCYKNILTKVYIGFNNTFKSLIFIGNATVLSIVTVVYNEKEECHKLGELTLIWLIFHYFLLSVACVSCCTIWVVTLIMYRRAVKRRELDKASSFLL